MTTDEMVAQVYTDWGEDSTNSIISPAQITSWLNKAQRALALKGQVLLTCATTSTVAGQETYNVPGDYLKAEAVFCGVGTARRRLYPKNVGQRDPYETQGLPTSYWIWGENQSGVNIYVIGLNPIPSTNGSSDLEIFYRQMPAKMIHSTQGAMVNPEVIEAFQDAMIDYALMSIYRRLGPDFRALYNDHHMMWNDWVQKGQQHVNPNSWDIPIARQDTGNYLYEYTND
jgi:hypothetical protein